MCWSHDPVLYSEICVIDDDVLQFSGVRLTAVRDKDFFMHVSVLLLKLIAEFKQSCFIAVTK